MSRVKSKNLFNFQLNGVYDDDVAAADAELAKQLQGGGGEDASAMAKLIKVMNNDDPKSNQEYVKILRDIMESHMKPLFSHPILQKSVNEVIEKEIKVPTNHDGNFGVPVFVYTPKKFLGDGRKHAAYIYAHGGGCVGLNAKLYKSLLCHYAVECDVVVFNVDYRLAPETKCPNNVKDYYEVIKYVSRNANNLGIDANKIVIGGESGGGYVCLGSMVMLAQRNEAQLVKVAIPAIPMVDDYSFTDTASMTKEEQENNPGMRKIWKLLAVDFEAQKSDPLLFPGKSSDQLLEKFPPTIIEEAEFDMFITEATRLAYRLRRAGRLLELIVIPGGKHGSSMDPKFKNFKIGMEARKKYFQHYVHD